MCRKIPFKKLGKVLVCLKIDFELILNYKLAGKSFWSWKGKSTFEIKRKTCNFLLDQDLSRHNLQVTIIIKESHLKREKNCNRNL